MGGAIQSLPAAPIQLQHQRGDLQQYQKHQVRPQIRHEGNGPGGVRTAAYRARAQPRAAKPAQGSGRDPPVSECQVCGQQRGSLAHPRTPHS